MIKRKLVVFFLAFLLTSSLQAGTTKHIALKDGSVIKGELISFENGTYTLQTDNLGRLQLPEANVISISNDAVMPPSPTGGQAVNATPVFSNKVNAMQNQIMGNPQAIQAVQAMAEDPEIAAMISDPAFVQQLTAAVSNNNIDSVAGDPKIQQLMNNPKMQALIQQLQDDSSVQP